MCICANNFIPLIKQSRTLVRNARRAHFFRYHLHLGEDRTIQTCNPRLVEILSLSVKLTQHEHLQIQINIPSHMQTKLKPMPILGADVTIVPKLM